MQIDKKLTKKQKWNDVDYNKHNIVKYLANNKDKDIWKIVGEQYRIPIHQVSRQLSSKKAIHSDTPSIPNEDES